MSVPLLIDTHCHLDFPELTTDLAGVLARARANGVGRMITIATRKANWPIYLDIADSNPNLYCTVGVHPDHAPEPGETVTAAELIAAAHHPKVVGFGECGLDYHYESFDKQAQLDGLYAHITAAQQTGLPVVIHSRDADEDMAAELTARYRERPYTGLLHCFTSGPALAQAALDIGFYISFSGIVTFKNAKALQDIARSVPIDRMLIETDAPYLAPVPMRGKSNEPSFIKHTAQYLADLKGMGYETFVAQTTKNAETVFSKLQPIQEQA